MSAPLSITEPSAATSANHQPGASASTEQQCAPRNALDGKYLLSTSDPDLTVEDVALGYKNLLEAERGFRDLKSTLELRPVFHRLEHRITAHVLICWLALLLIRVAERRCDTTWARIATELGRIHAITIAGTAGTAVHTTPPSDHRRQLPERLRHQHNPTHHPPQPHLNQRYHSASTPPGTWTHATSHPETPTPRSNTGIPPIRVTYQLRNPGRGDRGATHTGRRVTVEQTG
ncbi:MAG: hypothetical protein M5U19_14915 [Microthrixaceae bacterium]|nr:hypothetical protein [Microthrixaceae bacterium]